jgi:twitching motility protein PilJ
MAKKTDTTPIFRLVALVIAMSLLGAMALVYLQAQSGGGSSAELAALSQSIPARTADALTGRAGAFDVLERNVGRLAELRRGAGVPGNSADWQQLESRASAILARRTTLEAVSGIGDSTAAILELSNELLTRSGSTAAVQEFQRRANNVANMAAGLASDSDAAATSADMAEDTTYLRAVSNALSGEESELDIAALDEDSRAAVLEPLAGHISNLEAQVEAVGSKVGQLTGLDAAQADVSAAANKLANAFAGSDSGVGGLLPGFLMTSWIPVGLMLLAIVLVAALVILNVRMATFERLAHDQGEQNERNQQAILRLLDEMGSLADGDLTVEATVTEDITGTIADSFNYAIEELRKLVATVNETAIMVDSAAKQTESAATHMSRAADNQTKEINAATESIVSMAASIEEVSGNAERSSDVARHSVEVAHKGGEAVRRTIDGMNTIRETIQDTSKRIKRLGESSQEIGNIVELINDIAEQTNILALNASIQASMAGEAGRGFAVVADEVQRLAERSTNATKQIEVLTSTIQADTKEAVVSMERSTTDVVGGALLAENAGAALDEIEQVSNQIASLVQNISSSARQQAGSAADVTRRTTRLREISEQTGKATTATAAAISKLSEFATQLRRSVAGFTLPGGAMGATTQMTATSSNPPAGGQAGTKVSAG